MDQREKIMFTTFIRRASCATLTGLALFVGSTAANASGDLLVAPTRIVLDGPRGAEIVLNNVGDAVATYRISLELRRMQADGSLDDVTPENATPAEQAMLGMLVYSPRRVTLPPNQPQTIRIGVRAPAGLPDGEYRAHMLFRAIPDAVPVTPVPADLVSGVSIALTPIYGVTIPIIVRQGNLSATAALSNPRVSSDGDEHRLQFDLARVGNRSVYGEVIAMRQGLAEPVLVARGIAIYAELASRVVTLPLTAEQAQALHGPVTIRYVEDRNRGSGTLAEVRAVLP